MIRLALSIAAFALDAGTAWAHEDAQKHTHGEVVAGVIVLAIVFVALVVFARVRGRQRGDR
ncbi:MAG: hypothetical protein K2X34_06170 [Hyphomonadaceae bacterium]|nr:hypothetical protein [Hyphomonadaceae bacterium]